MWYYNGTCVASTECRMHNAECIMNSCCRVKLVPLLCIKNSALSIYPICRCGGIGRHKGERGDRRRWRSQGSRASGRGQNFVSEKRTGNFGHRNRANNAQSNCICRCGGIGRHKGLKIPRSKIRTGSIPVSGTNNRDIPVGYPGCFACNPAETLV